MTREKGKNQLDTTTEARIKQAARVVFHKKGYAATRTRDIAEEAGINLALLNYYFRSKEKLFEQIMLETMFGFMKTMVVIFNDASTTLEQKVSHMANNYIDLILLEPEIPLFILSEIRRDATAFVERMPVEELFLNSVFIQQYKAAVSAGRVAESNPLHFLMNLMGLVIFPFIASPFYKKIGKLSETQFNGLMEERKSLVPVWINAILKPT